MRINSFCYPCYCRCPCLFRSSPGESISNYNPLFDFWSLVVNSLGCNSSILCFPTWTPSEWARLIISFREDYFCTQKVTSPTVPCFHAVLCSLFSSTFHHGMPLDALNSPRMRYIFAFEIILSGNSYVFGIL